ncbi:MAG: flippase-like domain-containing protein, partial [Desulfobacteraceae bacterium]|nr:flippase-like domain-containing protein [Desulfobacteraceae bacterium]
FSIYHKKTKILISSLALSFVWQLLFLVRVHLLVVSTDVPLDFVELSWIASLVLLVQALPISLSGIGLRETAYAFLFRTQGLPPEKGVLIGILIFSQMLLISAIGGILQLLSRE